ncbi:hypothetical protein D9619_008041 [Psilocybe cf. subviscida]|uniref:Uncharacterized protein n=1 Tax=Psilocybe cf. subviscida TaxID=2480587 RepID=A0A8H5AVB9_9AGAR|nr:hypothetical protein D9619_008041 [Psilocybe cf. subviscida]
MHPKIEKFVKAIRVFTQSQKPIEKSTIASDSSSHDGFRARGRPSNLQTSSQGTKVKISGKPTSKKAKADRPRR